MTAFYNEIDPGKAEWLRNLIAADVIAPGVVDERDIRDITSDELAGYTQCHFFAGVGTWSYALRIAGWPDQRAVWTSSWPCQPHSAAASERGKGFGDDRDLWPTWFDLFKVRRPGVVFGEQVDDSAAWIARAKSDMEAEGHLCAPIDFPACAVGTPIERMHNYLVAIPDRTGCIKQSRPLAMAPEHLAIERAGRGSRFGGYSTTGELGRQRRVEPGICPISDDTSARLLRLRTYGEGIVAEQAAAFIKAFDEVTA